MKAPTLSIIIVNYNNPHLLDACLQKIDRFLSRVDKEVVVVDNNSKEQYLAGHQGRYHYLKPIYLHENTGFGYANNVGVKNSSGDILLLLNSDTEFIDDSFEKTLENFSTTNSAQLWGTRLIWPDGKFQQSYSRKIGFLEFLSAYTSLRPLFKNMPFVRFHKYYEKEFTERTMVDVVYGTAVLIRKSDYEKLGGFSKKYFMYFEDVDLCDRFISVIGGQVIFDPATTLIHRVKGSSRGDRFNLNFTKSQYLYGGAKFGYFPMILILPFDVFFGVLFRVAKKVFREKY